MTGKKIGLNLLGKENPVLKLLGIRSDELEITGVVEKPTPEDENPRFRVYTGAHLNAIVGEAARKYGLNILESGAPFLQEYVRAFAPDTMAIVEKVRAKNIDVMNMGGMSFVRSVDENEPHGHFVGTFGTRSECVLSFEGAIDVLIGLAEKVPAPIAAKLLQEVVAADMPISTAPRRRAAIDVIIIG